MAQAQDIYNPETWTEQDRQFLDAIIKLDDEQRAFLLEFMQLADADPEKQEARAQLAEQMATKEVIRTAEGRASFLEALRAV